jgi:hypothetical protein
VVTAAVNGGKLIAYWGLPMFTYASTNSALQDRTVYTTLIRASSSANNMMQGLIQIFLYYKVSNICDKYLITTDVH